MFGVGLNVINRLSLRVGNTDGFSDTRINDFLKRFPCFGNGDFVGFDGLLLGIHPPAGIAECIWFDEGESDGEMYQKEVDVVQTPGVVLGFHHFDGVVVTMVIVPEFGGDKDVGAGDDAFGYSAFDSFAGLAFILVVVGAVEEAVSGFDRLEVVSVGGGRG